MSKIEEKKPIAKVSHYITAYSLQYQQTPINMIIVLPIPDERKLTFTASKPTLGSVRCFTKRPLAIIQNGVKIPNRTAIHFGMDSSIYTIEGVSDLINVLGSIFPDKLIQTPLPITKSIPRM